MAIQVTKEILDSWSDEERVEFAQSVEQKGEEVEIVDTLPQITPDEALEDDDEQRYSSWDDTKVSHAKLNPNTEKYLDEKKGFWGNFKDSAIESTNIIGSAVQDGVNTVLPFGEVDFMGENYNNPYTGVQGTDTIADVAIENGDLPIDGYNAINKLAKTQFKADLSDATPEDLNTFNTNLHNVVVNHLGFDTLEQDEDTGKYYAIKDGKEVLLNKDGLKEIVSDVYGDKIEILGAMIGGKKAYDTTKPFGKKIQTLATLAGGGFGASIGNMFDQLDSVIETGEKLSLSQRANEMAKAGELDMAGGAVVGGLIATPAVAKNIYQGGKNINDNIVNYKANKYVENKLQPDKATSKDIEQTAQSFGGKEDQTLTTLADQQDTQAILADNFLSSVDGVDTILKDHDTLTQNLYNKTGVTKITDDAIGTVDEKVVGDITESLQGLEKFYHDTYMKNREDLVSIIGNESITSPSSTLATTKKFLNSLAHPQNVKGEKLANSQPLTEFEKDYKELVSIVNRGFKQNEDVLDEAGNIIGTKLVDSDGYNLTGLMDMQKKFNEVFYKYKDDFSASQKEKLTQIKDAIYDDMQNYIHQKMGGDIEASKKLIKQWEDTNKVYGEWKADKLNNKEIEKLLDSDIDVSTFANDLITKGGSIDKNHANFLATVSKHLSKTNQEDKLDSLYDGIVNNLINNSSITTPINGQQRNIIDFEKFIQNYDAMKGQKLNKIFAGTKKGDNILKSFEDFRKLADYENYLQEHILKKGNNLSEAVKTATEKKQAFLFGVEYFIRRTLVMGMGDKLIRSEAYKTFISKLAKKQRYDLVDFDDALDYTKRKAKHKNFNIKKEDIDELTQIRKEASKVRKEQEVKTKELLKQLKEEEKQAEQKRLFEEFMDKQKQEIDALSVNALPHKSIDAGAEKVKLDYENSTRDAQIQEQIQSKFNNISQEQLDVANLSPQMRHEGTPEILSMVENATPKNTQFQPMIMTIKGEEINKTNFDLIQAYQKNKEFNRKNPDKKRTIPQKQIEAYNKHMNIEDDIFDMEFKEDAKLLDTNYAELFELDKQSASIIKDGTFTPQDIQKLKNDIITYENHPDFGYSKNQTTDVEIKMNQEGYTLSDDGIWYAPDGEELF
jgi:hypothetical protein